METQRPLTGLYTLKINLYAGGTLTCYLMENTDPSSGRFGRITGKATVTLDPEIVEGGDWAQMLECAVGGLIHGR